MRLQLTFVLTGVLLAVSPVVLSADGDSEASARFDVYSDEWITVVSPAALGMIHVGESVDVEARYTIDILSGATPVFTTDAVTSATRFTERRHQVYAGATYVHSPTWSFGTTYNLSFERDFVTHALGAGGTTEVFDRMAAVTFGYSLGLDTIGLADDATFSAGVVRHGVDLEWAHILSKSTVLTVLLAGQLNLCDESVGCHSSPYRYVPILRPGTKAPLLTLRERHPGVRGRGAAAVRIAHYLSKGLAVHGGYRLYGDNWRVWGHTFDASIGKEHLIPGLLIRLESRFTWQDAASFYRDDYSADDGILPEYRTDDRELAGVWDVLVGGRVEYSLSVKGLSALRLNARVSRIWYVYPNFTELPRRNAWLIGGGANVEF